MWITVDPRSSTPIYQQVMDAVKAAIARGLLPAGSRMPSVRELATSMTLNHNTVAKAYQELEREGIIEVLRGRGTFVAAVTIRPDRHRRIEALTEALHQLLVEAHYVPLTGQEVLELFQQVVEAWERERGESPA
jgi:GntR family transcriptional regulator